ncbi:hypothetical protein GCM10023176_14360 [Micromonospora coerulea]|uniref:Uncharacterized protein n=1 Tax=Micromonospora coerulea TaxID=47856 RepID=A0ABP8SD19_9ACTN
MLAGLEVPPAVEAERVITAVLALRSGELAAAGDSQIILAQTNEQVDDLIDRLAQKAPELRAGRLSAADYTPSQRVTGRETVRIAVDDCALGKTKGPNMTTAARRWLNGRRGDSGHRHSRAYLAEVK